MGDLKIILNGDGTVKIDARGMKGTTPEIMRELTELAKSIGGELVVEKHEPGHHHHHGVSDHVHN